jgi:hypothetical protein
MSDDASRGQLSRWISSTATMIAPASALSAVLFYFGYVSSRAQYEYFGVDVDTIELSTQDYIMRSPQPLLVPLLVLTIIGAALLILHALVRERIAAAGSADTASADNADRGAAGSTRRIERAVCAAAIVGIALLGVGVVLLFTYSALQDWPLYNIATPLLFTLGGGSVAYASRIRSLLRAARDERSRSGQDDDPPAPTHPDSARLLRRAATILIYTVVTASVFWCAATVAQWSGRGQGQSAARHLDRLPRVILDTKERLFLRSPGIEETSLPASEGQSFRYRYRRLRLLIVGRGRMFLVPDTWSASNSTLVVPLDGTVRVQFQFQNERP